MTDVLVQDNFGYHNGGGIDNRPGGFMTLRRVSVVGNRAGLVVASPTTAPPS
jgi:hypothetical protein